MRLSSRLRVVPAFSSASLPPLQAKRTHSAGRARHAHAHNVQRAPLCRFRAAPQLTCSRAEPHAEAEDSTVVTQVRNKSCCCRGAALTIFVADRDCVWVFFVCVRSKTNKAATLRPGTSSGSLGLNSRSLLASSAKHRCAHMRVLLLNNFFFVVFFFLRFAGRSKRPFVRRRPTTWRRFPTCRCKAPHSPTCAPWPFPVRVPKCDNV